MKPLVIFFSVFLSGNIGIAGDLSGNASGSVWTTGNYGQTWTRSSSPTVSVRTVYINNSSGIVGTTNVSATSGLGIYKNSSPMCYGETTTICCLVDNEEKYICISDIKEGYLVKTYKCGYKPVKMIDSFDYLSFDCLVFFEF